MSKSNTPEPEFQETAAPAVTMAPDVNEPINAKALDLREEVVHLNRVAKVVKGGRRFSFSALVVVGDGRGVVGIGFGKANEVPDAIAKAVERAKKNLIRVPIVGRTIPYGTVGHFGAGRVMLKPASEGTGIIAGPAVRAVVELAGIRDLLTKVMQTTNQINVVRSTFEGLRGLTTAEKICQLRGKTLDEMLGKKGAARYVAGREQARTAVVELQRQSTREEKTRRGTYTAGGRRDDEPGAPGTPPART